MNPVLKLVLRFAILTLAGHVCLASQLNCIENIPFPFYDQIVAKYEKEHYEPDAFRSVVSEPHP